MTPVLMSFRSEETRAKEDVKVATRANIAMSKSAKIPMSKSLLRWGNAFRKVLYLLYENSVQRFGVVDMK